MGIIGGFLALPRLLARRTRLGRRIRRSPLFRPSPKRPSPLTRLASAAVWPAAALVLFAEHTRAWGWTLAYCLYLQLGPWTAGRFLRSASPGLLLPGGVGLWLPGEASPRLLATPDPYYVSWVHTLTGIAPLILWVACVFGARRLRILGRGRTAAPAPTPTDVSRIVAGSPGAREQMGLLRQRSRGRDSGSSSPETELEASSSPKEQLAPGSRRLTVGQIIAWLIIAGVNTLGLYRRMPAFMGYGFLLFSPGVAWAPLLAMLLAVLVE